MPDAECAKKVLTAGFAFVTAVTLKSSDNETHKLWVLIIFR